MNNPYCPAGSNNNNCPYYDKRTGECELSSSPMGNCDIYMGFIYSMEGDR